MSRYGSASVGTAEGTPREGALMVPVSSRSPTSSPGNPALRRDSRVATPALEVPVCPPPRARSPHAFEVRCADAHPEGCEAVLGGEVAGDAVALALEHGSLVHGFTSVWYGPERLAIVAAAVTRGGGTR